MVSGLQTLEERAMSCSVLLNPWKCMKGRAVGLRDLLDIFSVSRVLFHENEIHRDQKPSTHPISGVI